jgi:hypothetical protein
LQLMPRDPDDTKGTIARRGEKSEVDVHWLCATDQLVGYLELDERLPRGTSLPLTLDSGWRLLLLITGDENRFKAEFRNF